jgi:hypothetical protein
VTGTAAIAITTAVGSIAFGDENDVPILPRDTVVLTSIRYDWTPPPGTGSRRIRCPGRRGGAARRRRRRAGHAGHPRRRDQIPAESWSPTGQPTSARLFPQRSSSPTRPPGNSSGCPSATPGPSTVPACSTPRSGTSARTRRSHPGTTPSPCSLNQATSPSMSSVREIDSTHAPATGAGSSPRNAQQSSASTCRRRARAASSGRPHTPPTRHPRRHPERPVGDRERRPLHRAGDAISLPPSEEFVSVERRVTYESVPTTFPRAVWTQLLWQQPCC